MGFLSPLWLLGVLPWAGVAIWLLLGRRQPIAVPFIELWRGPTQSPRAKPALARPPLAVLLAILALLFTVLACAGPRLHWRSGPAVTIILDRGITMSARGEHIERFKETCNSLASHLLDALGNGPVRLIPAPGGEMGLWDRTNWTSSVGATKPSLQQSQPALDLAIRSALDEGDANVIVVSDQDTVIDPRLFHVYPQRAVSNLSITNVAARSIPRAQVMVDLRDQGNVAEVRQAKLRVESDGQVATQEVRIPRNGDARVFVDLPALGPVVGIDVDAPDDLAADNQAWLARERRSASIEDSPALAEPLRRMIAVYQRHRQGGGKRVAIVTDVADAPVDGPSIVIPIEPDRILPTADLHVEDHPVSANVNWTEATHAVGASPPPGYRAIVSAGDMTFVAVRETPVRSVWVCLNSPDWPARADYVIFWTNVFDWLGGEDVYRWHPLDSHAQPGVDKDGDGTLRAYNAIDVDFPRVHPNDWNRLRTFNRASIGGIDLTSGACLLAIVLMTLATVAARRKN